MTSDEAIAFVKNMGWSWSQQTALFLDSPRRSSMNRSRVAGGRIEGATIFSQSFKWWRIPRCAGFACEWKSYIHTSSATARLVRVAPRFPARQIAQVREEHTTSGRHVTREVPFPKWVPPEVTEKAKRVSEKEALAALGPWALVPNKALQWTPNGGALRAGIVPGRGHRQSLPDVAKTRTLTILVCPLGAI